MKKQLIQVRYTVMVTDREFARLVKLAHESGHDWDDAGPILSVRRLLMSEGVDGAFPGEHQIGLEFALHDVKSTDRTLTLESSEWTALANAVEGFGRAGDAIAQKIRKVLT
jgi:hypothetical protein